ncbi:MAG: hypothetical protein ACM3S2_01405 [Ignavibacteriales bacterium]
MKTKLMLIFALFIPQLLFAQYWQERTTEQNFENSDLFFKSHFLNTFALPGFKNVAPGFIHEPFLDLYNNPASLPDLKDKELYFYLDFRGDRQIPQIVGNYITPYYYSSSLMPAYTDYRWMASARQEPEPTFTIGVLTYPIKDINNRLFIGGSYQMIYRNEKYYTMPFYIYTSSYGYDSFNAKVADRASVPVIDRYAGTDEMLTRAYLFTAYAGYRILDNLQAGVSINGVTHDRTGAYGNINNSEYGNTSESKSSNSNTQDKDENYHHIDFSAGLLYKITPQFEVGAKAGRLTGKADQAYNSGSSYFYQYKTPFVGTDYSLSNSVSETVQSWNRDGKTSYLGLNFTRRFDEDKEVSGFYRYSNSQIDLSASSAINDTSFYAYSHLNTYNNVIDTSTSRSWGSVHDIRNGTGSNDINSHEVMLNFSWKLSGLNTLQIGFYYNSYNSKISDIEPVTARRYSEYISHYSTYNYSYLNRLYEIKHLRWDYDYTQWSVQIPVMLYFNIQDRFGILIGINRILKSWDISDQTTAFFALRQREENGPIKTETNFGERYKQPNQHLTENTTDVITRFDVKLTPQLKVNLLLDPEFDGRFNFAQWWMSLEARL